MFLGSRSGPSGLIRSVESTPSSLLLGLCRSICFGSSIWWPWRQFRPSWGRPAGSLSLVETHLQRSKPKLGTSAVSATVSYERKVKSTRPSPATPCPSRPRYEWRKRSRRQNVPPADARVAVWADEWARSVRQAPTTNKQAVAAVVTAATARRRNYLGGDTSGVYFDGLQK
jgi:hypothetical protein